MKDTRIVDIDLVEPNPYQPRLEFDDEALMDLAQSIRENGLIQPITVREMDGRYQIIAGERRFRALKLNGAVDVPVLIMDANEVQMAEMALVENIQRENLSAIEEAKSYVEIMKNSGLNQSQLALRVGKSQSSIANKIRLLNLDEDVQEAVSTKKISERHARALIGLDEEKQHDALEKIVKKGMTVAQTEKMLKEQAQPKKEKKKVMLKGISKNIKIAINTIHQAISMVNRAGTAAEINEEEHEDEVIITIRIPK
ncbi:ParB/RepB/Spo0J family partition protein [[Clostridium] innocuum]|nr:ParB/RepB/Spo0J family partition protein [[Clostridium] innocuum]